MPHPIVLLIMDSRLALQIIALRNHFISLYPNLGESLDWICFSSFPPALISAENGISLKDWYHTVREKLSNENFHAGN